VKYFAFPSTARCLLLVDMVAAREYPEFLANLLSSCGLVSYEGVERVLDAWLAVRKGHSHALLEPYLISQLPEALLDTLKDGVLAVKWSEGRAQEISTLFFQRSGRLYVKKCRGGEEFCAEKIIYEGVAYDMNLYQRALESDWQGFIQGLNIFVSSAFERFSMACDLLTPCAVDAVPRNSVVSSCGEVQFFDLEVTGGTPVDKSFYIYRVCVSVVGRNRGLLKGGHLKCIWDVYRYLCQSQGLKEFCILQDMRREAALQARHTGKKIRKIKRYRPFCGFDEGSSLQGRFRLFFYSLQKNRYY
jgi:hypothetical protein